MAQSRPSGDFYQINDDTNFTIPTARSTGILNTGGIPISVHQLQFAARDVGVAATRDITYSFHRSSGGTVGTPFTPVPLRAGTGDKVALSTGVIGWGSFPNLNSIFTFQVNVRKGLLWQAKKGKEFRAYSTEGFHLRFETLGAPSVSFHMIHSIIFEE